MQENLTIARPYAQAVFEQAKEENAFAAWSDMLDLLKQIMADQDMQQVLDNPRLDGEFITDFVLDLCADKLSPTGQNLVRVLADAGRLNVLAEISDLYAEKRAEAENVVDVEVLSAYPLDAEQESAISSAMKQRCGRDVEIKSRIDESLIGGVVIKAGDSVVDASLKGRLKELSNVIVK